MSDRFFYGGQAVIEGVMIRGRRCFSLAVRRPKGEIYTTAEPIHTFFSGSLRKIPLLRGVLVLIETLVLGVKALTRSASIALEDEEQNQEVPGWVLGITLMVSLALGIGIFFVMPLFLTRVLDPYITSDILSNFVEGVIRLLVLVGYLKLVGLMKDIRRVFAYHGAEHMAVHAHEAGLPLEAQYLRRYPTAHPRCGTAFLLVVMVISILAFAMLGRPSMEWRILSRILLVPVIAGVSYEVIRFSGAHSANRLVRALTAPSLWLQSLTTRQPDDKQLEVAIAAMQAAIAADEGRQPAVAAEPAPEPPEGRSSTEPSPPGEQEPQGA